MSETIDVESTVQGQPAQNLAVAVRDQNRAVGILRPADSLDHIAEAFREYQKVCETILDKSDYQEYEGKPRKKKSAWRKLATAFNVSTAVVKEEVERTDRGQILSASFTVRAYVGPKDNPHRQFEAVGYCDISEKCCATARGDKCHKAGWKKHYCCAHDCDGRKHWSHPDHDVRSTAQTRASNRAIADLIGCGEVSAEELTDDAQAQNAPGRAGAYQSRTTPAKAPATPSAAPATNKDKQRYATVETRKWMISELGKVGLDTQALLAYFIDCAIIMPNEKLDDIPLRWVPVTKTQLALLVKATKTQPAKKPYDPNPELLAPAKAKEAPKAPPARKEDWFFDVICPIPRKGMKRDEYLKAPDTIGSLYDAAAGDQDSEAGKRLFGFANRWKPEPREYNGKVYQPSEADHLFREALDAFLVWHEDHEKGKAQRGDRPTEEEIQAEMAAAEAEIMADKSEDDVPY